MNNQIPDTDPVLTDVKVMVNAAGMVVGLWPVTRAGVDRMAKEGTTVKELLSGLPGLTIQTIQLLA
jgi:hypothetical protein